MSLPKWWLESGGKNSIQNSKMIFHDIQEHFSWHLCFGGKRVLLAGNVRLERGYPYKFGYYWHWHRTKHGNTPSWRYTFNAYFRVENVQYFAKTKLRFEYLNSLRVNLCVVSDTSNIKDSKCLKYQGRQWIKIHSKVLFWIQYIHLLLNVA